MNTQDRAGQQCALTILGIETSCDETAAAILRFEQGRPVLLAERIASQFDMHAPFGGVVPEIAARAHALKLDRAIKEALGEAGLRFADLDLIAATAGPGLIGGVLVGLSTAKGIALAARKPLIAINHLEGHALSPLLARECDFPYLLLLISGGHCLIVVVEGVGRYRRLGATRDDAAGECFDKAAKLMGLPQPGGPAIEREARLGDPSRFDLPRPLLDRPGADFSFAGLKTAVARQAEKLGAAPTSQDRADLCAALQEAVADILADRAAFALEAEPECGLLVAAGGVASNQRIRARLDSCARDLGRDFFAPPVRFCTDNAAMIALAGALRFLAGEGLDLSSGLAAPARPRWPLDEAAALSAPSFKPGRKGAKA